MREQLEKIASLTDDHTYSHAARMIEIKKIVVKILGDMHDQDLTKAGLSGAGAGKQIQEQGKAAAGGHTK